MESPGSQSSWCHVPLGMPECPILAVCPGGALSRVPVPISQVYHCRSLALAFMELTVVQRFLSYTHHVSVPGPLRAVLGRLSALYSLWSLSQHTALLYRGETSQRWGEGAL